MSQDVSHFPTAVATARNFKPASSAATYQTNARADGSGPAAGELSAPVATITGAQSNRPGKALPRRRMPRRDQCHFVGKRAMMLNRTEAAHAWEFLAERIETMGLDDMPKFRDLIASIRAATIYAKGRS